MLINNFKKMISILLAIVLISSTFGFMVFATQKGDVNNDGMVTAVDARLVLQFVAGLVDEKDIENMNCADVNDDSQITAIDARLILQIVAGIVEEPDTNGEKNGYTNTKWYEGVVVFQNEKSVTLPCTIEEFIETSGYHVSEHNYNEEYDTEWADIYLGESRLNLYSSYNGYIVDFVLENGESGDEIFIAPGIKVGMTSAQVKELLGNPRQDSTEDHFVYAYRTEKSLTLLIINFEDDEADWINWEIESEDYGDS